MAALFGSMNKFDPEKEEWTQYVERLDHFFMAKGIENVSQRLLVRPPTGLSFTISFK